MFSFFTFYNNIKYESEKKLAKEIIYKIEQELIDPKIPLSKKKKKLLIIKSLKYYFSL